MLMQLDARRTRLNTTEMQPRRVPNILSAAEALQVARRVLELSDYWTHCSNIAGPVRGALASGVRRGCR